MSKQEFYEQWRSKILQIPDLPLEKDTAASNDDTMNGINNLSATNWSMIDKRVHPYQQVDSIQHSKTRLNEAAKVGKGTNSPSIQEHSLTVSIVEDSDEVLRGKLRKAFREEDARSKKLDSHLGIKREDSKAIYGLEGIVEEKSSNYIEKSQYLQLKVSDLLKSAHVGNHADKKKAINTLFKYRRGFSLINRNLCELYTPNEAISRYQHPVEHLRCVNCSKSMNSHYYLKFKTAISDKALDYFRGLNFYEEMIMDNDIVIMIGTGLNGELKDSSSTENMLSMFLQQLSTCGMKVKDIAKLKEHEMKTKLYWKYLTLNCPLEEKDAFEDYIAHPEIPELNSSKVRISQV